MTMFQYYQSILFLFIHFLGMSLAAKFTFVNQCTYTIWPATLTGAGTPELPASATGFSLLPGATNVLNIPASWSGRMWARTLCTANSAGGNFSCATADAQNLYDDLYTLDIDTGIWTKIMPSGDGPSARFSMAGDCLDPSKVGVLVFIGGCNKNLEALDDMYFFHTELFRDDGRDERRSEKLSFRKQLKMKCQQQYVASSENDKAIVAYEAADLSSPISVPYGSQQSQQYFHLNMYRPPIGKRTFQAKVTKNFASGYSIETIIDGKPLRGVLFSTSVEANLSLHGKKDSENVKSKVNEKQGPITISPTIHESIEPTNASVSKIAEHSDVSQSQEVEIRESKTLEANVEVKKSDGAAAPSDSALLDNPSSIPEGSVVLPTSQEGQIEFAETT